MRRAMSGRLGHFLRSRSRTKLAADAAFLALGLACVIVGLAHGGWTPVKRGVVVSIGLVVVASTLFVAFSGNKEARERFAFFVTLSGIASLVVTVLVATGAIEFQPDRGCLSTSGQYSATVSAPKAVLYAKATTSSKPTGMLLAGCQFSYNSYCVGQVHPDALYATVPDSRLLILPGHGLLPSGQTVGPAPTDSSPSSCAESRAPPDTVVLRSARLVDRKQRLALYAQAPHAAFIGFAAEVAPGQWRRVAWDRTPGDPVGQLALTVDGVHLGTPVFAVPCLGFLHPYGAGAQVELQPGPATRPLEPLPGKAREPAPQSDPSAAACNAGQT
jgi:hypothetical protein